MKIVILGGTGFVGRSIVHALQARGHRIDVLSRNRELQRDLGIYPGVRTLSTQVYDQAALTQRFANADAVINLVGVLQNNGFGGKDFDSAHVALTTTVIAAMKAARVPRLLQMSSLRAGEGDSHYLRSRGQAEKLVKASGLNWTLFQPSVIFGPGDGLFCRFAPLLRIAPVMPLARAQTTFQPVYVKDVAAAFAQALADPAAVGKTYALVGPSTYTLADLVRYTAKVLGVKRWVLPVPNLFGRLQGLLFDPLPAALKLFSSDNFKSLALDSTSKQDGLSELGIRRTPMELVVPEYIGRSEHQRHLDTYRAER